MIQEKKLYWVLFSTLLLSCTIEESKGSVSSSQRTNKLENSPAWIDIHGESDLSLSAHQMSMRLRRDASSIKKLPNVTFFDLKNDTSHNQALIHWSGENSTVVFILTRKKSGTGGSRITESTLWRSVDYGATYEKMASKFDKNTILKSYFVCPTDKLKVIFVDVFNSSKRIWVSLNEGKSYQKITTPFSVEKIEFHPENSDWLMGYDKIFKTLYCSMNFGKNWHKLADEVTSERYYWYVKGVDTGDDASKIVHFEYRNLKLLPHRIYMVKTCYIPDCREAPFQKHYNELKNIDMDSLVVQDAYVFAQKSDAANKLYVSYKRGPLIRASFPYYSGRAQSHFHVVSSDGECVVLGVNHDNGLTHLFFSNLRGDVYTQSLSNVRYYNRKISDNKVYTIDIHEVKGVVGTYIANVHDSDGMGFNVTRITWDNGRSWSDITNAYGADGRKLSGCANCQLNMHLSMDQTKSGYYMPSILSKKSVPGLIIAHGTFGQTVEDGPNQVSMYISKDNGKTWHAAKSQRNLVVIADYGAIIVAIKMIFLMPVSYLDFSYDYGKSWTSYKFYSEKVNVDGILTEPGENTHFLTLFAHKDYAHSWKIFKLDMSPLFPKVCQYPGDFENITLPVQVAKDTCHLGLIQKTERLRRGSFCLINSTFKRITNNKVCECTDKDYECDLNYETKTIGGTETCERVKRKGFVDDIGFEDSVYPVLPTREQKCVGGKRNVTSGFRKIPGDKCKTEMPHKLWKIEDCNALATTVPPTTAMPDLEIQLLNKTRNAKMGENLMFSIKGTNNNVVWHIIQPVSKKPLVKTGQNKNLTLIPERPGPYRVQVSLPGKSSVSNMILVEFWYPIEKVYLYHPPVVARNKAYNATARTQTTYGLEGNETLLGEVEYIWDMETKQIFSKTNQLVNVTHSQTSPVRIRVRAQNTVSFQTTSGKIQVKEFVETLVLEMKCEPSMSADDMTDNWLGEFQDQLRFTLFTMKEVAHVIDDNNLLNEMNFFVYVPPSDTLRAYIYIVPLKDVDSRENLYDVIVKVERAIANSKLKILLARGMSVTVQNHYIIKHDGTTVHYSPQTSTGNGGVIAIAVIIVIILVVVAFFVVTKFARKRFRGYPYIRNLRDSSSGEHIVRDHDRARIVDPYADDDLDAMEEIGMHGGELQLQG